MNTEVIKAIQPVEVDKLHFDPRNPRLPSSKVKGEDEEQVLNWMLRDASIIELMGSIGKKGFFPAEPLLVTSHPKLKGHFVVVEGNRRLAAVRLLHDPERAPKRQAVVLDVARDSPAKPPTLPVIVYDTREEILEYLGFKHITGVKAWSPLAKAKYLRELEAEYSKKLSVSEKHRQLAKTIGSRIDYVKQLLIGLELYDVIQENDYYNIPQLDESTIEFGLFYNALRWANIAVYLGIDTTSDKPTAKLDKKHLNNLVHWVSEKNSENQTRLGESRRLRDLNEILGNKRATKAFESGRSLAQALVLAEEPSEIFTKSLNDSLESMQTANSYVHHVEAFFKADLDSLVEIGQLSNVLQVVVKSKL